MAGLGKTIKDEHDNYRHISLTLSLDPLVEDLKQTLEHFGAVSIDR